MTKMSPKHVFTEICIHVFIQESQPTSNHMRSLMQNPWHKVLDGHNLTPQQ